MTHTRVEIVSQWLETVAHRLREAVHEPMIVSEKSNPDDLVTEMDRWAENYLVAQIREHFPEDRILGEEGTGDTVADMDGTVWIIDPIDGTLNFVKSRNHFGIMIGIFKDGQGQEGYIYDVMQHQLYVGIAGQGVYVNGQRLEPHFDQDLSETLMLANVKSIMQDRYQLKVLAQSTLAVRSYGSSAIQIISLLNGEVGLYFSAHLHPWDFAAGLILCQAMGIRVTDHQGQELDLLKPSPVLFADPEIYSDALAIVSQSHT